MPSSSDNDLSKSFEPTPIDKAICIPPKTTSNTAVTKISSTSSSTSRPHFDVNAKPIKQKLYVLLVIYNFLSKTVDLEISIIIFKQKTLRSIDVAYNVATTELNKLCAVEGAMVFHTVKHSHSYISHACTIKIIKKYFPDSSRAKNITCDKTKAREIACNVLAPSLTSYIVNEEMSKWFQLWYNSFPKLV
ncbi:unnamed protein product [Rotaria magnacalcarata]|uniref:Uncharacterized protein n=1 Tax=Rotaria magnacalcarata TaxID=392030 RepID=A0A8S3F7H0_9BILA|nr:unnamed protein product [Rotaria magnacalcarata]